MLPGDPERRVREERLAKSIPLPDIVWKTLREAGRPPHGIDAKAYRDHG